VTEEYDVVIIGSGAGGGTLAHALATAGKRILILERGGFLPREMENWDPGSVFVDGRYQSTDTWYGLPTADPLLRRRGHEALRRGALPAATGGLR
jgi:choline dehydrogenase-like flavoprotein